MANSTRALILFSGLVYVMLVTQLAHAQPIKLELRSVPLAKVALIFSEALDKPVFIADGIDKNLTVLHPSLPKNQALDYFRSLVIQSGLQFREEGEAIYINKAAFKVPAYHQGGIEKSQSNLIHKVYRISPKVAEDASGVIQSLLKSTRSQVSFADGYDPDSSVSVLPDRTGLLVTALDFQHDIIGTVIKDIDVPQRLINIEAIVYETLVGDSESLGLNLALTPSSGTISLTSGSSFSPDGLSIDFGTGSLRTLFSALSNEASTKVLTKPNISLISGEEGYITVGQNVPFITSKRTDEDGKSSISVERQDIGVSLRVKADIMPNGLIRLTVDQSDSSLASSEVSASDVITNNREITTVLLARDGQFLSLGGLLKDESYQNSSGTPVFRSLPVVGSLFEVNDTNQRKTLLNVVLRASITDV